MSFYNKLLNSNIENNGNRIALECDDTFYTFKELDDSITYLSERLTYNGIKKSDKVIILQSNPIKFTMILLALIKIEAIAMPLYSKTNQNKVDAIVESFDANFLIKDISNKEVNLYDSKSTSIHIDYDKGENSTLDLVVCRLCKERDSKLNSVKLILFTSGTTSTPKAIMLTENNICANIISISKYLKLKVYDNILLVKDLSHSSSITSELFIGLYNGCKVVMTNQMVFTKIILRIIEDKDISVFFGVPTLIKGIMECTNLADYNLNNLRIINFYGASMGQNDIVKLIEKMPNTNIIYSYGLTEASPRVTYIEKNDLLLKPVSCGKAISGVTVTIEDNQGNELEAMQQGEIVVQGENVMLGYYKNLKKTKYTLRGNKLHTKDIGYLDEDGFLYVTGRGDNMIVSAGKNIYPEEIEKVLTSYDEIQEALCVQNKKDNEAIDVIAYVVLNEGKTLSYEKLRKYCKENLEIYKIPKKVLVVDYLEKTPSGKIKRDIPNNK